MKIRLSEIIVDPQCQQRPIDRDAVEEFAELMNDGVKFPPIGVVRDGKNYIIWDGFHRFEASKLADTLIIDATVTVGTLRNAIWLSFGANKSHGVRRPRGTVKAILAKMLADTEWSTASASAIAKHVGASRRYVESFISSNKKQILTTDASVVRNYTTKHGTPAKMNVANIGAAAKKPVINIFDDDDPPPATKSSTTHPATPRQETDRIRDKRGSTIERKEIIEVFERIGELEKMMRSISEIRCAVEAGVKAGEDIFHHLSFQQFKVNIDAAYSELKFTVPYAICPYCGDDRAKRTGCKCCNEAGWVPKEKYDAAPESLKAGAGK